MKLLPHWVLTDKHPAFYDCDSATAIEMVAKIYGAMNSMITEYNEFSDSVNGKVEEFMNDAKEDSKTFAIALRQEFQDFIDVIELKYTKQDQDIKEAIAKIDGNNAELKAYLTAQVEAQNIVINEAVQYMKDNIANSLQGVIEDMRDSGELGEIIMDALNDFTQRVNQLETDFNNQLLQLNQEFTAKMEADKTELKNDIQNVNSKITYVTPQMFGAKADGITNDTQAFIEALAVSKNIYVPVGNYLITPEYKPHLQEYYDEIVPSGIWIHESDTQMIFEKGAVLICDTVDQNNMTFYGMITIRGKGDDGTGTINERIKNVVIDGATIIGGRSQYNESSTMENGLGINVSYADDVTIQNCTITDNMGDSIFTYASDNVKILNCKSRRSRRGAISIGSCNGFIIDGCDFAEEECTITYPNGNTTHGTNPNAIICVENDSFGAVSKTKPQNIYVRNCVIDCGLAPYGFLAGGGQGNETGGWKNVFIQNNHFKNIKNDDAIFLTCNENYYNGENAIIENNIFDSSNEPINNTKNRFAVSLYTLVDGTLKNNTVNGLQVVRITNSKTVLLEGNVSNYGIFGRLENTKSDVVKVISNNGKCNSMFTGSPIKIGEFIINGNNFDGTDNAYDIDFLLLSTNGCDNVTIENNHFISERRVLLNRTNQEDSKLLIINNTFVFKENGYFYWVGSAKAFKGDIVGNYFETPFSSFLSITDFNLNMNIINNIFKGASTNMVSETNEHIISSGNIHIE